VLVEVLTDNRNRTVGEVRHVFSKRGANLAGSVAWQFETKGLIVIDRDDDAVAEAAIEAGADDIEVEEGATTVYTGPTALYDVVEGLQRAGIEPQVSQLTKVPQSTTALSAADAARVVAFLEALEELDDVQNVYSTADLSAFADPVAG